MSAPPNTVTIKASIGLKEYSLRVNQASENDLNDAVALINSRFNSILSAGKVKDPERIAIMVALNLAAELNKLKQSPPPGFDFPDTDIASMRSSIGQALRSP